MTQQTWGFRYCVYIYSIVYVWCSLHWVMCRRRGDMLEGIEKPSGASPPSSMSSPSQCATPQPSKSSAKPSCPALAGEAQCTRVMVAHVLCTFGASRSGDRVHICDHHTCAVWGSTSAPGDVHPCGAPASMGLFWGNQGGSMSNGTGGGVPVPSWVSYPLFPGPT